jgi:hypothetical protein
VNDVECTSLVREEVGPLLPPDCDSLKGFDLPIVVGVWGGDVRVGSCDRKDSEVGRG